MACCVGHCCAKLHRLVLVLPPGLCQVHPDCAAASTALRTNAPFIMAPADRMLPLILGSRASHLHVGKPLGDLLLGLNVFSGASGWIPPLLDLGGFLWCIWVDPSRSAPTLTPTLASARRPPTLSCRPSCCATPAPGPTTCAALGWTGGTSPPTTGAAPSVWRALRPRCAGREGGGPARTRRRRCRSWMCRSCCTRGSFSHALPLTATH